ncbi:hypothetical protein J7J45_00350 [Candidatus Aerophobetes bacterium]|nr:hypothetical protein [Candidatus Aerophobetes bacterium]
MYEIKLNTKAARQIRKLDPHIKGIVKRRLKEALSLEPYKYSFLSGKYSGLRRVLFLRQQVSSGRFILLGKIRKELLCYLWDQGKTFIKNYKDI